MRVGHSASRYLLALVCLSIGFTGCATAGFLATPTAEAPQPWPDSVEEPVGEITQSDTTPAESIASHPDEGEASVVRSVAYKEPVELPDDRALPLDPKTASKSTEPEAVIDDISDLIPEELDSPGAVFELDLSTALAMASGQNPRVAFAAARYREAYADLEAARALWLPSIRAGASYNKHDGRLQAASGSILEVSRGSFQTGLGVRTVGAGAAATPGIVAEFHLSDAIYQPRIANRVAAARRAESTAITNDLLLDTALAYLDLLEAAQEETIAEETLENAQRLADLTRKYSESGQGSQADADRAQTELSIRENRVVAAGENIAVASARLNELLHMDPATTLLPQEPTVVPIDLASADTPIGELLATGMSQRPELEEAGHLVGEAVHRYRREKYAMLLPSAFLAASYGSFGGGNGATLASFDDRVDFDAAAFWEIRNLGFGEAAARDRAMGQYQQVRAQRLRLMDRVAREIVEARAQVESRQRQIATAEQGIESASNSYERNVERIRSGEGLPLEVLQSIHALDQARREYLRTVVDYNESQFRLHRALGWPIH